MMNPKRKPIKKSFARETISKFLPNEWTSVKDSDLMITQIQEGFINTSFIVENKAAVKDPSKVLLRKYGGGMFKNKYKDNKWLPINSEAEEGLICHQQSKSGNGPKVYGFFPGGRVEEFIPSHTLGYDEAVEPEIIKDLALSYARYHCQGQIELDKTRYDKMFQLKPYSTFVFKHPRFLDCWMSFFSCCCRQPAEKGLRFDSFLALDIAAELKLMKKVIFATKSKHVLLHQDTQYLNILVRDEPSEENKLKTVLIDYEISLYGPRLLDIAGHFNARMISTKGSGLSGYEIANEEQRKLFLKCYSEEIWKLDPDNFDKELDSEDHLMMETDVGLAAGVLVMIANTLPFAHWFLFVPHFLKFFSMWTDSYVDRKKVLMEKYPQLFKE